MEMGCLSCAFMRHDGVQEKDVGSCLLQWRCWVMAIEATPMESPEIFPKSLGYLG